MSNSADPDQTAPRGVWSGSALFAIQPKVFEQYLVLGQVDESQIQSREGPLRK